MLTRTPPQTRRGFAAITAPLVLVLAAGCGLSAADKAAISQFSRAATTVGEVTASELVAMRDAVIQMNVARLTLTGREQGLPGPNELEQTFTAQHVTTRVAAANALRSYGEMLLALSEDRPERQLRAAADQFVSSVRSLPDVKQHVTDSQLDAIGTAVQTVGGLVVEWKKKRALESIVPRANPAVARLCDLLAADFDPTGTQLGAQLVVTTSLLRARSDDAFRRATTPGERASVLTAYRLANANEVRRAELLSRVAQAVRDMKKANAQLTQALANQRDLGAEDLKSFSATVNTLVTVLQTLSKP